MLGLLIRKKEAQELEYIIKRELEELLLDFEDERIEETVKKVMEEKYKIVFGLYRRIASPEECSKYIKSFKNSYSQRES
ncbi:glutamyl-tRNA reductase [Salibacterium salarium]|uniref:Uncharacterized protein n=1 Tax=Salibacterium salarium TaxID=284579 RepID=A0A3R9QFA5_9BACI|nr:hypothetical protein [Salibacterium salarium]MDQ0300852.1 glutamyl-tRNA reductase [Salibacterium salarium]RSL29147.1 hypothetical protein D7Z54_32855 [Salibacterium salarium]